MFESPGYELKFIQRHPCRDQSHHLFSLVYKFFSPATKLHYILLAQYHDGDVFAIKFYCKQHKSHIHKYSKIVNKGDIGNIFITCVKVIPILLSKYPNSSFGLTGARSIDFKSLKVENYDNNQRFRIYRYIIALKFGSKTFAHYEYEKISSYLLVNRNCIDVSIKERELAEMFSQTYNDLHDV